MTEGKEHLQIYCQSLLAGLKGAAKWPTNLTKVREVQHGPDESLAFVEWLMKVFYQYTLYDSSTETTVTMTFTDHLARDIRKKLQRLEGL